MEKMIESKFLAKYDSMKPNHLSLKILVIVLLGCLMLTATSSSVTDDPYTGLYYVHGSKIMTFYTCPFIETCTPDDGPFMDTTRIASVVAVKWMEEKTDTLHFFGLPGADEGESKQYFGLTQIDDAAGNMSNYGVLAGYKIYGSVSDDSFTIQYNNAGFHYDATGTISNDVIDIEGTFYFRTISVDYDLTGERIYTIN
jgi:hypothetical protein